MNAWQNSIQQIIDDVAPLKPRPHIKKPSPYISKDIKQSMNKRDALMRKAKRHDLTDDEWLLLKSLKRKVKSRLRHRSKVYGKMILAKKNQRESWKYLRQVTCTQKDVTKTEMDTKELNVYLSSVVTDPKATDLLIPDNCVSETSFCFQEISSEAVLSELKAVKIQTAAGHDNLTSSLIRGTAKELAPQLTSIFNRCIQRNCFPNL